MFALFRGSHNRLLIHHMDALFCLKITTSKYHVLRFSLLLAFEYWNPICSFLFSAFTPAADTENAGKSPRGFFSSALKTFTYNLSQKSIVKSTVKCSMSGFSLIYFQSSDKLSVSSSADHVWEPGSKPSVEWCISVLYSARQKCELPLFMCWAYPPLGLLYAPKIQVSHRMFEVLFVVCLAMSRVLKNPFLYHLFSFI